MIYLELTASNGNINTYAHVRVIPTITSILQNNDAPQPLSSAIKVIKIIFYDDNTVRVSKS